VYWACAQFEPPGMNAWRRTDSHWPGYEIYQLLPREQRRSHGRRIIVTPPLFPGYLFYGLSAGLSRESHTITSGRLFRASQPCSATSGYSACCRLTSTIAA
jgi:hypothetical protein